MPESKNSLSDLLYDIKRIAEHREKLSEKRIQAMYRTLSKNLDSFIADGYKKYADEDGRFYTSYLDAQNKKASFLQEIVDNVDFILPKVKNEIMNLVNETYDKSYKGMIESFKKADTTKEFEDVTKDIDANPYVLKQAVNNNIGKLTLNSVMEKHRQEITYQLQKELSIGLMQGFRYEKMAKRISERVNVSYNKAMNITRTETHRNIEGGFMDCAEHIQGGLGGSDLIYAATWRTMKDERVRPNQRRKTKKGWVTKKSKNGANHQMMEGVTVKAGELFDLGGGVKAKAPSQSGVAAHDCNCRCFLEYNLMTVEEFAKATGQAVEEVRKKYNIGGEKYKNKVEKYGQSDIIKSTEKSDEISKGSKAAILDDTIKVKELKVDNFPDAFKAKGELKNTQAFVDYINSLQGANADVIALYNNIGKLESMGNKGIPFSISHSKNHAVTPYVDPKTGNLVKVKLNIPKLQGENLSGQVNTILHEEMHLMDLYGRKDPAKSGNYFSESRTTLVEVFKDTSASISNDMAKLFSEHKKEYLRVSSEVHAKYDKLISELNDSKMNGTFQGSFDDYERQRKKLVSNKNDEIDYLARNIMGGGIGNLEDIYDALSGGVFRDNGTVLYGHGSSYYKNQEKRVRETIANYAALSVTRPDLIEMLKADKPDLVNELGKTIIELLKKVGDR